MQIISSRENEQVKYACHIAASSSFRRQEGLFFAEGLRLCADLQKIAEPQMIFFTQSMVESYPQIEWWCELTYRINDPVNDKLALSKTPQGIYGLFKTPQQTLDQIGYQRGVLWCERIQDPTNIGTILRSAAAFGLDGVVLDPECADPFSPAALRASMGAVLRLPVVTGVSLKDAAAAFPKDKGRVYGAVLLDAEPLASLQVQFPFALMIGNEGHGLSQQAAALITQRVCIPMRSGIDSLNAAAAAAVFMYEFTRQSMGR